MRIKGNLIIKVLIIAAAIVVLINAIRLSQQSLITQSAKTGSYSNSVDAKGYIVREETVLAPSVSGVLEPACEESQRIGAYTFVGSIVSSDIDQELISELEELNGRIEAIRNNMSDSGVLSIDESRIDSVLTLSLSNLRYAAAKGSVENAVSASDDIRVLLERKMGITSSGAAQQNLDSLIARRDSIAASLGGVRTELYAPVAGVFSKNVDGMESVLTPSSLSDITPERVDSLDRLYENALPEGLCKIINNYAWYAVANLTLNEAEGLTVGKSYTVTFNDVVSHSYSGTVSYISEPDEEGRCAIVFKFNTYAENFTSMRKVDMTIVKAKFSGIYIPAEAVRVKDNVTGVYVRNTKSLDFKSISIVYRNDDFILAKEGAEGVDPYSNISAYDNIVIDPDDDW